MMEKTDLDEGALASESIISYLVRHILKMQQKIYVHYHLLLPVDSLLLSSSICLAFSFASSRDLTCFM